MGKVTIGDGSFDIEPGCAIFLPTGIIHEIMNTGDQELIFVCADAPVFDEEDVFES
jgi:mannose-6-phosphate isomerase-like protein (cupin superfamily)